MEENKLQELEDLRDDYIERIEQNKEQIEKLNENLKQYENDRQIIKEVQKELDKRNVEKEQLNKEIEDLNHKIEMIQKNTEIMNSLEEQNIENEKKIQELYDEIAQIEAERVESLNSVDNEYIDKEKWYNDELKRLNQFLEQYKNDSKIQIEIKKELNAKELELKELNNEKDNKKALISKEFDIKISVKNSEIDKYKAGIIHNERIYKRL